jgi:hypothetical protein
MNRPFRSTPRTCAPGEPSSLGTPDEAIWKMFTEMEVDESLATRHPDERVPMALLRRARKNPAAVAEIARRAMEESEAEGVAWTPLLDWVCRHSGLPLRTHPEAKPAAEGVIDLTPRLGRLADWAAEQEEEAAVRDLLEFKATAVHEAVAGRARVIPPEVVEGMIRESGTRARLAGNEVMSPERFAALQMTAVEKMQSTHDHPSVDFLQQASNAGRTLPRPARQTLLALCGTRGGYAGQSQDQRIRQALLCDPELGTDELLSLIAKGAGSPADEAAQVALHPAATPATRAAQFRGRTPDPSWFLRKEVLPRDLFGHLMRDSKMSTQVLSAIILHPSSPPEVWEEALRRAPTSQNVRSALARNPRARHHPPVRAVLLGSASVDVLLNLFEDPAPHEFVGLFRKVARIDPEAAIHALENKRVPEGVQFDRKDIDPLFRSGSGVALRAFAQLNGIPLKAPKVAARPTRGAAQ